MQFKKGFLRGIRHQIRPTVALAFAPNYQSYYDSIQVSNNPNVSRNSYNRYQEYIYGGPPNSGPQLGLNFNISNTLEAKVMGRRDTVARKVKIFESFWDKYLLQFCRGFSQVKPIKL